VSPLRPSVTVIGAGIVGSYVAYELARAGCSVEVIDPQDEPNASSGNAGILAVSYAKPMSNPRTVLSGMKSLVGPGHGVEIARPLTAGTMRWLLRFGVDSRPWRAQTAAATVYGMARRSVELYDELADRERVDLAFRRTGWLYVARDPKALRQQQRLADALFRVGVRSQRIAAEELAALEPSLGPGHLGAVLYPDDVAVDPGYVTATVADAARRHGARFTRERVVAAELRPGSVKSLRTDADRRIAADRLVIATGGDSAEFGKLLGVRLPVERAYGWNLVLPTAEQFAVHALMNIEDHVVINSGPGSLRITGGMQFGGRSDALPTRRQVSELRSSAEQVLPAIKELESEGTCWRGARPMTTSGLPIVRRCNLNTFAVTGHGTLGMTLAPKTARDCRDLVLSSSEPGGPGPRPC
jgi:D-amino-acid dehydrogenase